MRRLLLAALLCVGLTGCGGGPTRYDGRVMHIGPIVNHRAEVWVRVVNIGHHSGRPALCNFGIFDVNGGGMGAGHLGPSLRPLRAGQSMTIRTSVHLKWSPFRPSASMSAVACYP